jgi:hypothetical protein
MTAFPEPPDSLRYVVGAERRLKDVLSAQDVVPLLREALKTGVRRAAVVDADGETLWSSGEERPATPDEVTESRPLHLEGEPVGLVRVGGDAAKPELRQAVAGFLGGTLTVLAATNLKPIVRGAAGRSPRPAGFGIALPRTRRNAGKTGRRTNSRIAAGLQPIAAE